MGSNRSRVITDVFGRNVRIAKEKLNLILKTHPKRKKAKIVGDVLRDPEYKKAYVNVVIKIERSLGRLLFY